MHKRFTRRRGEDREKGEQKMLKGIMAGMSPNLLKNIKMHIQVTQQNSGKMNSKRSHKHIILKNTKIQRQGGNLESTKRKITHHLHGNPNKINK